MKMLNLAKYDEKPHATPKKTAGTLGPARNDDLINRFGIMDESVGSMNESVNEKNPSSYRVLVTS